MCFFRMPVQYVIEEWDFRDLTLKMKRPVFIPRPETEVKSFSDLLSTCPNFATNWEWTSNGCDFLDKHRLCVWKHLFPLAPAGLCASRSWLVWFLKTSGWYRGNRTGLIYEVWRWAVDLEPSLLVYYVAFHRFALCLSPNYLSLALLSNVACHL